MNKLREFETEVLSRGVEACLPKNLPDYWLYLISHNLDDVLINGHEIASETMSYFHIIIGSKINIQQSSFSILNLFEYFQLLRIEFAFEVLNRFQIIKIESATIETILTDRNVVVSDIKTTQHHLNRSGWMDLFP